MLVKESFAPRPGVLLPKGGRAGNSDDWLDIVLPAVLFTGGVGTVGAAAKGSEDGRLVKKASSNNFERLSRLIDQTFDESGPSLDKLGSSIEGVGKYGISKNDLTYDRDAVFDFGVQPFQDGDSFHPYWEECGNPEKEAVVGREAVSSLPEDGLWHLSPEEDRKLMEYTAGKIIDDMRERSGNLPAGKKDQDSWLESFKPQNADEVPAGESLAGFGSAGEENVHSGAGPEVEAPGKRPGLDIPGHLRDNWKLYAGLGGGLAGLAGLGALGAYLYRNNED